MSGKGDSLISMDDNVIGLGINLAPFPRAALPRGMKYERHAAVVELS